MHQDRRVLMYVPSFVKSARTRGCDDVHRMRSPCRPHSREPTLGNRDLSFCLVGPRSRSVESQRAHFRGCTCGCGWSETDLEVRFHRVRVDFVASVFTLGRARKLCEEADVVALLREAGRVVATDRPSSASCTPSGPASTRPYPSPSRHDVEIGPSLHGPLQCQSDAFDCVYEPVFVDHIQGQSGLSATQSCIAGGRLATSGRERVMAWPYAQVVGFLRVVSAGDLLSIPAGYVVISATMNTGSAFVRGGFEHDRAGQQDRAQLRPRGKSGMVGTFRKQHVSLSRLPTSTLCSHVRDACIGASRHGGAAFVVS